MFSKLSLVNQTENRGEKCLHIYIKPTHKETKPKITDAFLGTCGTWHNLGINVLLPLKRHSVHLDVSTW